MLIWLMASGHSDAEAGHPDVAEECQEVDEEVKGEVDGGHVELEGNGGQGRVLLVELRSTVHAPSFPVTGLAVRCGVRIEGRYGSRCTGRHQRQSLQTSPDFPQNH